MSRDCEQYEPGPNGKTCRHYDKSGACTLPGSFMCVVWLRKNGQAQSGGGLLRVQDGRESASVCGAASAAGAGAGAVSAGAAGVPIRLGLEARGSGPAELPTGFQLKDVVEIKGRGIELCLQTTNVGDVWIVPEHNPDSGRQELTYENLATLVGALLVFPGSRVTSLKFPTTEK